MSYNHPLDFKPLLTGGCCQRFLKITKEPKIVVVVGRYVEMAVSLCLAVFYCFSARFEVTFGRY